MGFKSGSGASEVPESQLSVPGMSFMSPKHKGECYIILLKQIIINGKYSDHK